MTLIGFGIVIFVNPEHLIELMAIQTQVNSWLNIMQEDAHFAPPEFVLEQLWNRLEKIISSSCHDEDPESL